MDCAFRVNIEEQECRLEPHNEQTHSTKSSKKMDKMYTELHTMKCMARHKTPPKYHHKHATYVSKQCRQVSQSILFSGFQKFCRLGYVCAGYLYRVKHTNGIVSCTPKMFALRETSMFNSLKQCERNNGKETEQLSESQHVVQEL